MRDYIIRRLIMLIPILLGISIAIFVVMQLIPGDVVSGILGIEQTPELRAMWEKKLGLDKPLVEQYFSWIGKAVTGDFGESFRTGAPVFPEIMSRFKISAELAVLACIIAWIIALPLGVLSSLKRNSVIDRDRARRGADGRVHPQFRLGHAADTVPGQGLQLPYAGQIRGTF